MADRRVELEASWATLGIDPAALSIDSRGSIRYTTQPPYPGAVRASPPLPRLAIAEDDRRVAELKLGRVLGQGGRGVVKQATQLPLGREVVVKVAREDDPEGYAAAELLREAQLIGALEHPNIIPVHLLGNDRQGLPMMVMKRVDGVPWSAIIDNPDHPRRPHRGRDLLQLHLEIMIQVCNAVHFAHSRGILHLDLKPDNVMIGAFGEVYVVDWGSAVALRDNFGALLPLASQVARMTGTPQYMAPEMVAAEAEKIGEPTDVYLLGSTLHHCLTGQPRHHGPTMREVLHQAYASDPIAYPASIDPELAAICNRATHLDPERRFPTAAALRDALLDFLQHRSSLALSRDAMDRLRALQYPVAAGSQGESMALDEKLQGELRECRFGFRHALREWPANPVARQGQATALRLMAEYQLSRGDHGAAAVLLSEMEEPPADLEQRVAELRERAQAERAEIERLRDLERQLDPDRGRRTRAILALLLAVIFTAVPLANGLGERRGWFQVGTPLFLLETLAFGVVVGAGFYLARHILFRSILNRTLMRGVAVLAGALLLLPIGCALIGLPIRVTVALQMLVIAVSAGSLAAAILRHFLVPCLVFSLAFLAIAAAPALAFELDAAAKFISLIYLTLAWRRPGSPATDPQV